MTFRQFNSIKYVDLHELCMLADELVIELDDLNMAHRKDVVVWFLRNRCYAPFSAIKEALGYSTVSNTVRAYRELVSSAMAPVSLDGEYAPLVKHMALLADGYYDLENNPYLDRLGPDTEPALLYLASESLGVADSRKNAPSYTPTPTEPPHFVLAAEVVSLIEAGDYETVLSNYHIQSNK